MRSVRLVRRSSREFVERVFVCAVGVMTTGCLAPTEATLSISSDTCHDDAAYHATNIMVVSSQIAVMRQRWWSEFAMGIAKIGNREF